MKDILPTPISEKRIPKVIALTLLIFCLLPTVLNIACLTPIYFNLENNAVYRGTAIPLTVKYISDLFDLISFGSVYATLIFSLVLFRKKITAIIAISYCCLLLFKIPARLLMNSPLYGTIGTKKEIIVDLMSLSFYFLIEIIQFAIVFIFVYTCAKSYLRSIEIIGKNTKRAPKLEYILPIHKFINWYNPLLRAAVYSSITVTVFKFVARLITDIDAGAPTSFGEVMIMIVNYLTDAIYGIVAYIIAIFIFNLLFERLTKLSKNENDDSKKENKADKNDSSALFED